MVTVNLLRRSHCLWQSSVLIAAALLLSSAAAAQRVTALELIKLSDRPNDKFRKALLDSLGEREIVKGTAWAGHGPDFIFAVEAAETPILYVDGRAITKLRRVKGWNLWFCTVRLETGRSHSFYYEIRGRRKGGLTDIPAYLPDSYPQKDVPQGTLSEKFTLQSKIYPRAECDYWIYVPAQYDPAAPAALMVWQDGEKHITRNGPAKTLNVIDNLTHKGKIPVMITVFTSPCTVDGNSIRAHMYDHIDDTYARFLRDELLPEVAARYKIRTDAYSRAIAGVSSGALAAFNAAWHMPDQFSRVISFIGSYTSVAGIERGGHLYPFKVRKEAVRNLRVWLQDGSGDLENDHGSWPLMNIQLANSLKLRGYDFHFSFGNGSHSPAHGYSELPRAMEWLWRGYDPAKTQEVFVIDPKERKKPLFRVEIANR